MPKTYYVIDKGTIELGRSLKEAIQCAKNECSSLSEEEGGVIVSKDLDYEFIKLRNQHTGNAIASGFYEADREEYGQKVIAKFEAGFKNFASFHTHPTGFRAYPSTIDLTRLFNGFPDNFIWSPSFDEIRWYSYIRNEVGDSVSWEMKLVVM